MNNNQIASVLSSNIDEDEKKKFFEQWLYQQPTPQPIKGFLENNDILTELAAVLHTDSMARQVVFDLLTKYGTLNYPKR